MATQARPGINEFSVGPWGQAARRGIDIQVLIPESPPRSGTGSDGIEQGAVTGRKAQIKTQGPWNKMRALRHERRVQKQKTKLELQS